MLRETDRISLVLMPTGLYTYVNNLSIRQKALLAEYGVLPGHFKTFADDVNRRKKNPINSQVHKLPEDIHPVRKKRGSPP